MISVDSAGCFCRKIGAPGPVDHAIGVASRRRRGNDLISKWREV
jgi:hypothetical protein